MNIQISEHFTYKKILKFTLPSIIMMIFTSIYSIVDGFFVSNFVGKVEFTAVNFIMPFLMILGAIGFMFGTGGSALIGKCLGERDTRKANDIFSMIVYISIFISIIFMVLGIALVGPIADALGAEGEMLDNCILYGRVVLLALPAYMLQFEFQSFFVVAGKPQLGLAVTIISGVLNMILDAIFVAVLPWGLVGAAAATAISQSVGGIFPFVYFFRKNSSNLKLTGFKYDGNALIKTCTNGSSELMTNISISVVSMLYNAQLIKFAGNDGVAAYGVIMYVNMIFLAAFIGYSVGAAPIVSYHYGAGNIDELKNLKKTSLVIIGVFSGVMTAAAELSAKPLALIFVSYDAGLLDMTIRGFMIYSFSFLFAGTAIYGSSFFTALNNGLVSAVISFLRTLVFQVVAVLTLPLIWGIDGIWISTVIAELIASVVTIIFIVGMRRKYKY